MSEQLFIQHCAPTLAGLKTGNLFPYSYRTKQEMQDSLRALNHRLGKKGLRVLPVRYRDGRALVYVYRPSRLLQDLGSVEARHILRSYGYQCERTGGCIARLIARLRESAEFPHEIGLFLGYPPEDVQGFICEKRKDKTCCACKCVGHWKVYGNEARARRLFVQYKKCTAVYSSQWASGKSLEHLTVAG